MKLFVFIGIVCLLEYRNVVSAAFVQILIFICIDRIDLKADHAKILSRQLAGFTDRVHITLGTALAGKEQDLFHTGLRDDSPFMLDLRHIPLHAVDMVVAGDAAVNATVLAVVGHVQWVK